MRHYFIIVQLVASMNRMKNAQGHETGAFDLACVFDGYHRVFRPQNQLKGKADG
jgi:hypothetical protein